MSQLRILKSKKIKNIPCKNPHSYCDVVEPIYEIHLVNREELTELPCRTTHRVKARSSKVLENDNLYAIFLKYTKYDVTFIRNWLKVFMLANNRNFERRAAKYLASKVLSYDNWCDSITQGRKGDVLALYGLCMLFSRHAVVHLHNNLIWSTLASIGNNHSSDLQKCDIHLCYLGRGLFMELVERDKPLQMLEDKPDMQSLIIGELKIEEGLLPTTSHTEPTSDKGLLHLTYAEKDIKLTSIVNIVAVNMKLLNPNKSYHVSQQQLLQLPMSKYRQDNYYDKLLPPSPESVTPVYSIHDDSNATLPYSSLGEKSPLSHPVLEPSLPNKYADSDTTLPYSSSDETILYCDYSDVNRIENPKISKNTKIGGKSTKRTFEISFIGIRRRRQHYLFKCIAPRCNKTFNKVKDWNAHHRLVHKNRLRCMLCGRMFTTPSAHRAHKNYHVPHKYNCNTCGITFAFESGLKQHKVVHTQSKLNHCFIGTCKKAFKWPQDLVRHIKKHMQETWSCTKCDMVFAEKRLLKRHEYKHLNIYRYRCNKCNYKSKWPTPFKRHLKLH